MANKASWISILYDCLGAYGQTSMELTSVLLLRSLQWSPPSKHISLGSSRLVSKGDQKKILLVRIFRRGQSIALVRRVKQEDQLKSAEAVLHEPMARMTITMVNDVSGYHGKIIIIVIGISAVRNNVYEYILKFRSQLIIKNLHLDSWSYMTF